MTNKEQIQIANRKVYWEKNIEGFTGFYDEQSEERIQGNLLISHLYKKLIFPSIGA